MGGSFSHVDDKSKHTFRFDLIENMRDAYEACKMMHFMIRHLSNIRSRVSDDSETLIKEVESAYYDSVNSSRVKERTKHINDPICENCNKPKSHHLLIDQPLGLHRLICTTAIFTENS